MAQMEQPPKTETAETKQPEQGEGAKQEKDVATRMDGMGGDGGGNGDDKPDDLSKAEMPSGYRDGDAAPPGGDGGESENVAEIDPMKENIDREKTMDGVAVDPEKGSRSSAGTQEVDYPPNKLDRASEDLNKQFPDAAKEKPKDSGDTKSDGGGDDDAPKPDPPKLTL